MNNIVAIVGRPNVGKSTFFNRLIQRREAIVDSVSGVTRDRNYGKSEWNGKEFSVIDTGGYIKGSDDIFEAEIRKQVELAIDEADVIIFDEATSALDNDTESTVMQALEALSSELTIVIVAHRLTTLKKCNQIIELENGKIKRIGKYEAIIKEN